MAIGEGNSMSLIEVRNLVKAYGGQDVLRGLNFQLSEGEIKVVMGPSGCGKSTFLRCLNRLVDVNSGQIFFRDQEVTLPDTNILELRKRMGFVFQQFALYRNLDVLGNVTLALIKIKGMDKKEAIEKAEATLQKLGMADHIHKYASQLSGGQQQRVAIARCLVMDPDVILFDEPTSALDPVMSREVATVMSGLRDEKVSILCVTHDLQLAQNLADKVSFIYEGVINGEDTINDFAKNGENEDIRNFFNRDIKVAR